MLGFLKNLWRNAKAGSAEPVIRPAGLSRRDFLRAMGVTSTTVFMGGMGNSVWKPPGDILLSSSPQRARFGNPAFIGKSYVLDDESIYVPREAYNLEFFAYETSGATIGHTQGMARVDFAPSGIQELAIDAVNEFTRQMMREQSFFRRVMPPITIDDFPLAEIPVVTDRGLWLSIGDAEALARADFT